MNPYLGKHHNFIGHEVVPVPDLSEVGRTVQVSVDNRTYSIFVRPCGFGRWGQDAKPLVCFHGFAESGHTWDDIQIPGYMMYQIDFLGHGGSSTPQEVSAYTYEALLPDIHQVLRSIIGTSYAVMGYSQGARFALLYALTYGNNVAKLILESGSVGIENEQERLERYQKDCALADAIEARGITWFEATWRNVPIFQSQHRLSQEVQDRIKARRLHNLPHGIANALRGMGQGVMPYVGNRIVDLSMPLLYISGALDQKYTSIGKRYFNSVQHVIEGVGHNTHMENPRVFEKVVTDFL